MEEVLMWERNRCKIAFTKSDEVDDWMSHGVDGQRERERVRLDKHPSVAQQSDRWSACLDQRPERE